MSLDTSKMILKIAGIISIIFGILGIIGGIAAILGGSFLGFGVASGDVAGSQDLAIGIGALGLLGLIVLLDSIVELISGVFSVKASKDISKIMPAWVFSLIGLILSIPNLVSAISSKGDVLSSIVALALNALVFFAANTIKHSAGK